MCKALKLSADSIAIEVDGHCVRASVLEIAPVHSAAAAEPAAAASVSQPSPTGSEQAASLAPRGAETSDEEASRAAANSRAARYTMQQPHLRFACCTCESATQMNVCKHQLAVLLRLYPGVPARRTMARMLGTRLGMSGGCKPDKFDPEALRPLLDALQSIGSAQPASVLNLSCAPPQAEVAEPDSSGSAGAATAGECSSPAPASPAAAPPQAAAAAASASEAAPSRRSAPISTESRVAQAEASVLEQTRELMEIARANPDAAVQLGQLQLAQRHLAHLLGRMRSEASVSAANVPQLAMPSELTSKRRKDCIELAHQRKATAAAPQASRALAPMPVAKHKGKTGVTNVWKRHNSLAGVVAELTGHEPAQSAAKRPRDEPPGSTAGTAAAAPASASCRPATASVPPLTAAAGVPAHGATQVPAAPQALSGAAGAGDVHAAAQPWPVERGAHSALWLSGAAGWGVQGQCVYPAAAPQQAALAGRTPLRDAGNTQPRPPA